ncbi:fimbrial protein [Corynebacterium phocae]|uniref:Fimbrial protein n=2 Tax=Corynebacterium phocae TaxID=161895 RepID=A0A1L7D672_9CORY|nr:fimbrial protein [Corynebacterium phocae]
MSVISVILTIVGLVAILYPVAATIYMNSQQQGAVEVFSEQQESIPAEKLAEQIEQAREWNAANQGGPILDPWLARISKDNELYQSYTEQLALTQVMGQVTIPSIDSKLPIYHGTTEEVLTKGIGHLFGSGLPVGGEGTHAVLTGHTGIPVATLWDNLIDVKKGDAIYLTVSGEDMKYKVYDLQVVLPGESDSLRPIPGRDVITLITCTPYGINSHRLLVHAERVPMDPDEDVRQIIETVGQPWQWWMTAALVIVGLFLLLTIYEWVRNRRRDRKKAASAAQEENNVITAESGSVMQEENDPWK